MQIREAQFPSDQARLVTLIREYAAWLHIDMTFYNFDAEMAQGLYLQMGFKAIAPYYGGPTLATDFFELRL